MAGDENRFREKRFRVWLWDPGGVPHYGQSFDTYAAAMEFAKSVRSQGWSKGAIYDGTRRHPENPPEHHA